MSASKKEAESPPQVVDDVKAKLTAASKFLSAAIAPAISVVSIIFPYVVQTVNIANGIYQKLPHDGINALVGLVFCFFGGIYPTVFAALQAARSSGWDNMIKSIKDLSSEALIIIEESKKDDEVDADGDGIADVKQVDGKALILRKTKLVLAKCNPEKINLAIGHLYVTWMAVVLCLKVQFARTIALSLSISDSLRGPAKKFIQPTISALIPDDYKKWVPVVIDWTCKSIGMSIAWYVQTIISAFTSATYGGLKFARSTMKLCVKKGWTLFGLMPKNHKETFIDEVVGWTVAALGFYFQFKIGFDITFPFSLILWPLETAEWYIRWAITE